MTGHMTCNNRILKSYALMKEVADVGSTWDRPY